MKTWAERIAKARERGRATDADLGDLCRYRTCFLGEAMRDAGHVMTETAFIASEFDDELLSLACGSGDPRDHPANLMRKGRFDEAERLRLAVRARVAKLYGPMDDRLISATVEEAKRHAAEKGLVDA